MRELHNSCLLLCEKRKIKKNLEPGKENIAFLELLIRQTACCNVILLVLNKIYVKKSM